MKEKKKWNNRIYKDMDYLRFISMNSFLISLMTICSEQGTGCN